MAETDQTPDVSALTVQLLSAYLANNTVPADALAELIRTTKVALTQDQSSSAQVSEAEAFTPAVTARKSLASPEHILSLIDGKPYKTLKRHLASRGLTPDEYRARYNLPASYPMVAPAYAEHRRAVAHQFGLGRKGPAAEPAEQPENALPAEATGTQLAPDTAAAAAARAKPSRKTSAKRAPKRQQGATSGEPDGSIEAAASLAQEANADSDATRPSNATSRKASAGAPRKPKAAATKPASQKSKPDKKADDLALDEPAPTMLPDTAIAREAAVETKPSKRRGKIGLFKSTSSDPVSSDASDKLPALAQADDGPTGSVGAPSATTPAKRGTKRMAREPKPRAA
jgi:predicted transcriptional regulator